MDYFLQFRIRGDVRRLTKGPRCDDEIETEDGCGGGRGDGPGEAECPSPLRHHHLHLRISSGRQIIS